MLRDNLFVIVLKPHDFRNGLLVRLINSIIKLSKHLEEFQKSPADRLDWGGGCIRNLPP